MIKKTQKQLLRELGHDDDAISKMIAEQAVKPVVYSGDMNQAVNWGGLVAPNALSASAFEHMNDAAGLRIHHHSNKTQSLPAGTASLAGLVLHDCNKLLSPK